MTLFRGFLGSRRIPLWVLFGAALLLFPLSLETNAHSAQVTLAWDANTEPGITGYKIYYGTSSRSYPNSIDVGNRTSCTVTNLLDRTTYYFAATDYNGIGQESAFSNEVSHTTPTPPSPVCTYTLTPTTQSLPASAGSGTVNVAAGSGCSWTAVSNQSWIIITSNSSAAGTGTVNYSVSANSGSSSRTGTLTIAGKTVTLSQSGSSAGGVVFAVNSGGSQYTSSDGTVYQSDRYYSGGSTWGSTAAISGTSDDPIYQSERYGNFSYSIPLPNGNYTVLLRFDELYHSSPGKRIFDVYIQGTKVISNLDIFALVGKNAAYDVSFPSTVADGTLNIRFSTIADNAKVSAILVTQSIPVGSVVFAVNSGGSQYTYSDGTVYQSDRYYSGGSTWITTAAISGTSDDPVYQSERYGNFSYSVPLPNGNYTVLLRFAEIYHSSPGNRIFDVYIQGTKVISNLDIFALVGKNAAYDVSFPATVADGTLNIRFSTIADNAKVNAVLLRTR